MNILVLNAGSSSLKYQLIEMPSQIVQCVGLVERIGMEDAIFTHEKGSQKHTEVLPILNHEVGLKKVAEALLDPKVGVITSVHEIKAIGHRVVHGGSRYNGTVVVTEKVKEDIKDLFSLAPLHNPAHLTGIEVAETIFTTAKQTVVFDTAFHQTMPVEAYQYAIPKTGVEELLYGTHYVNKILTKTSDNSRITYNYGEATASTKDFSLLNFDVYPNPTKELLTIDDSNFSLEKIQVFNVIGKKVMEVVGENKLSLQKLVNGVYLIKVHDENGNIAAKRILKN